jgi:hypothetical protein
MLKAPVRKTYAPWQLLLGAAGGAVVVGTAWLLATGSFPVTAVVLAVVSCSIGALLSRRKRHL